MIQKILADRTGYHKVVEELKDNWIEEILLALGIEEDFFDLPEDYQFDTLLEYDLQIIRYAGINAYMIIFEGQIIGEWLGPSFKLMQDDKGYYFEITLESWSILEGEERDE